MSRPMALGLVLLVLILTSQSDWKQDTRTELEENASTVTKQEDALTNRDTVKQEIILMQEKEIHHLKLHVKSLEEKLKLCQCEVPDNSTIKVPVSEQADTQLSSKELVDPVSEKATKLRGSVRPSRGLDLSERPSELPVLDDALDLADDDEEKIGDR
ncbi:hypothetical protein M758_7G059700 [Ceratodon purpureus]|uniref:Uncharacterized protein n=1 Tax=Ceratodon purpureus TaxID=3225 RepID=A0A8T0H849_CERPU|nr:hypothetical protein KC19_7G063100 [Ceratodon purpureus]KAG0566429.1 hypothetical protein KC19_7G063100 [Ceratodon purpureus]KAG0610364.1 hypothetical protein M758_7G059700 [Ceratodon purpureus]